MVQKYKKPFTKTQFEKTIDDIKDPKDLIKWIVMGANVARYKFSENEYNHIFDDFVDEHTKRMILYVESLPLSEQERQSVIRTLWIHDIPEIIDSQTARSDMTSTDKIRHPHLALEVKIRESAIVDTVFSPEDKKLYEHFEPAKEMLFSGNIDFENITPVGMLARVLDNFIDGTNSFHGFITDYLKSDTYDSELPLPQRDAFEYCFQRGIDVHRHVSGINHSKYMEMRRIILDILEQDFFDFAQNAWTPLAIQRLPEYARVEYDRFAEYMSR
jgi:hypothetical protein